MFFVRGTAHDKNMIKPLGWSEEIKAVKIALLIMFIWSISVTVVLFLLVSGFGKEVKLWEKQVEYDGTIKIFMDKQDKVNETLQSTHPLINFSLKNEK